MQDMSAAKSLTSPQVHMCRPLHSTPLPPRKRILRMSTIVIDDKYILIHYSIKIWLEQNGFTVVAETESRFDTLQIASLLKPQFLILELDLDNPHGLDVIALLSSRRYLRRTREFTACDADNYLVRCLKAGASGFVSKTAGIGELLSAVKTLRRGERHFPVLRSKKLSVSTFNAIANHCNTTEIKLTKREKEVLKLLAQGQNNKDIAEIL